MPPLFGRTGRGLDHSDESVLVAELFREQREGVEPPRQVEVAREVDHRLADEGQVPGLEGERVKAPGETIAPLVAPEVGGERLDCAIVNAELPVRVSARRDEQERTPPGLVQLGVGELDLPACEVGEDGLRVPELAALEPGEDVCDRVHVRIMACATSTISRPSSVPPTTSEMVWPPVTTSAAGTSTTHAAAAYRARGKTYATSAASTTARAL
jgi:hypothetical protein